MLDPIVVSFLGAWSDSSVVQANRTGVISPLGVRSLLEMLNRGVFRRSLEVILSSLHGGSSHILDGQVGELFHSHVGKMHQRVALSKAHSRSIGSILHWGH